MNWPAPSEATKASLARPFSMLIDGEWETADDDSWIDVIDPSSEEIFARIPAGGQRDVDRAVRAARDAFEKRRWTGLTPGARANVMWRAADLLERRADEFSELETLDNGKPLAAARAVDIPAAIGSLRYWAGWCTKIVGETITPDLPLDLLAMTLREPVGVVGIITPWNFPLAMVTAKLGPALAAGCTTVIKPAEQTSLTALRLGEILVEAGIPPGVVNIVTGTGAAAGAALANHADVNKITFTGSTAVGKRLLASASGNLKRLTLELGGKSPTIILNDADLERAAAGAANSIFKNAGQVCTAGSRLYVARALFDRAIDAIALHAKAFQLGPGLAPSTTMGPLVSAAQQSRVLGYIDSGKAEGASIATGGSRRGDRGYFVEPTLIVDAKPRMRVVTEEIFGPVLVAQPFDDLDEVVAAADDSPFGLAASIYTRDVSSAYKIAKRLRAGTVTINSGMIAGPNLPFGGFKQSGWGREGGAEGLAAFLETKTIITAL